MLRALQYLMLVLVLGAVAVATRLGGPWDLYLLAGALVGLLFIHLFTMRQVGKLHNELQYSMAALARRVSSSGTVVPPSSYEGARERTRPIEASHDSEPSVQDDIGSIWLEHSTVKSYSDDEEEIAFLPPYASDVQEGDSDGGDEAPGGEETGTASETRYGAGVEVAGNVPIPRHVALGTVAIIKELMDPAEVARVILEQRRQPRLKFGELAVQLGFITKVQLEELLLAQKEGLFSQDEIGLARTRLQTYRERENGAGSRAESSAMPESESAD
jgi:hypothetical protein